jgi:hypothetical protein
VLNGGVKRAFDGAVVGTSTPGAGRALRIVRIERALQGPVLETTEYG